MHATTERPNTVEPVSSEGVGESIQQRRTALGLTVKALAERAGVDRGRLAAIEDGAAARSSTVGAIEAALSRLEEEMGGPYDHGPPAASELIEFDITGDFGVHLVVKGPVGDAEILKRQVVDIIREIRKSDPDHTDSPPSGS